MDKALLPKAQKFNSSYENIVIGIQVLKTKNNQYQRMSMEQLDDALYEQLQYNKNIMSQQIEKTKKLIQETQENYKEPYQRNKLKQIRRQFEKQLGRHKIIMQNLSQKQSLRKNSVNTKNMGANNKNNNSITNKKNRQDKGFNRNSISSENSIKNKSDSSFLDQQQQQDFYFEERLMKQKNEQIGKLEQRFEDIHGIHVETGRMVQQQGQNLDIIGQQLIKAKNNTVGANQQLDEAKLQQKKSRKKYIILILCILLVAGTVAAVVFITT